MHKKRKKYFDSITRELRFTNWNPPAHLDCFWELLDCWRMEWSHGKYFCSCLGSLSWWEQINLVLMYTCPGWLFCPHKPHPFWEWLVFHMLLWVWSHVKFGDGQKKGLSLAAGAKQIQRRWWENSWSFFACVEETFFKWEIHHFLNRIVELATMDFFGGHWYRSDVTSHHLSLEKKSSHNSEARMLEIQMFSAEN